MGNGEKNDFAERQANDRKRARKAGDAEATCRTSSSSTNALDVLIEMIHGPPEDHCYSLQLPSTQAKGAGEDAKRKATDYDDIVSDREEAQGKFRGQKKQRWVEAHFS